MVSVSLAAGRVVRLLCAVLAVGVLGLAAAAPASAAVTTAKAIWGPLERGGESQMPTYAKLGVGVYEMQLRWERVAPTRPADPRDPSDPAYVWPAQVDQAIKEGAAQGIQVLLLVQGSPPWTNGGKEWNFPGSDPSQYADFITAAARRYPAVHRWMIWGEPNGYASAPDGKALSNFAGFDADRGKPLSPSRSGGPRLYARYLDAAYVRLKSASRRNLVIGGNTWTAGAVRPLHWIRALKLPNGRAPRMDLYGHNPAGPRKPDLRKKPQARGTADFSDLDTLVSAIDRNLGRRPGGGRINVFLSEYVTLTEHGIPGISYFLTRRQQAQYIAAGLRIVRRSPRVATLGIFSAFDTSKANWGLLDEKGKRKPSFAAFARG